MSDLRHFARQVRLLTLETIATAGASHVASCLSIADILAALYAPGGVLRIDPASPSSPGRDRFLLGKGHACAALYAALALRDFFPLDELQSFGKPNSRLQSHASHLVPGVEFSSGSLGHALSVAAGVATAMRMRGEPWHTYALLSDGELNEGSTWEALMFAGHHRLANLTVIIDANKLQSLGRCEDILSFKDLPGALRAFGHDVIEIDGHDCDRLATALSPERDHGAMAPRTIIAHTVKGKGVSFMEDTVLWHYRSPSGDDLRQAREELEQT